MIKTKEEEQAEHWRAMMNSHEFQQASRTCCGIVHRSYHKWCEKCNTPFTIWDEERVDNMIEKSIYHSPHFSKIRAKKRLDDAVAKFHAEHTSEGVLITLAIDQKQSVAEAILSQNNIVDDLRNANYKWLVCANAVYEYWSEEGLKYNPHIHIVVKKTGKMSVIRQHIARKFKDKKHGIYIFDVKKMPYADAVEYVKGNKTPDKMDAVEKDRETRTTHSIADVIII